MSFKVYKGFRIETESLAEMLRVVDSFRPWVAEQADLVMDRFMANMIAEGSDAIKAHDTWQDLRQLMRTEQRRIPHVDTDFTVLVIPVPGAMLGIVYTEQPAWYEAWCAQQGVAEYSYWDNSDAPDDMADLEWDARKRAWSVMTHLPASMQGFSIELVSPTGPVPKTWR